MEKLKVSVVVLGGLAVIVVLSAIVASWIPKGSLPLGSVVQSSEYHSTTTDSGLAAGIYYVDSAAVALGSIVITSTTTGTFTILDTDGTATTTVATMMGAATAGTYTFDLNLFNGLAIEVSAPYDGLFVTTYR